MVSVPTYVLNHTFVKKSTRLCILEDLTGLIFNEAYPEISNIRSVSPISDFCWPCNGAGECEFEDQSDGTVLISVFIDGVCSTPVLVCILPDPKSGEASDIYRTFMN